MTDLHDGLLDQQILDEHQSRRTFLKRAMAVGLTIPLASGLIAACGGDDDDDDDDSGDSGSSDSEPTEAGGADSGSDPTATTAAESSDSTEASDDSTAEESGGDTGDSDGEPVYGGTLTIVHPNDFVTMWPMFTTGPTLDKAYDWLLAWRYDGGGWEIQPWLAESWELNETSAIFHIREGVTFHDGTDLDAEAVRWNAEMWATHPQSIAKNSLAGLDETNPAEVLDTYSVQLNLTAPTGSLLTELSDFQRTTGIGSPTAFEELGEDGVELHAVGSGPFVFDNWVTSSTLTVTRNPDYWVTDANGNQLPYVDEIVYRWVSDDSVRLIEMRSEEADMTFFIRGRDIDTVKNDANLQYIEHPASGGTLYRIFFNAQQGPFAEDLPLRQAVQYAINRDAIAEAVGGGLGFAARYNLLPGAIGYSDELPYYEFDLDKAKELRAESSAPVPLDTRITIIAREADQQMAQMIQQMLGEIDVNLEVEVVERAAWGDQVRRANDFEVATQRTGAPPDPDQHWTLTWAPDGPAAYARMDEPEIWDLIAAGRESYDRDERQEIYEETQQLMHETAWWGNIWVQPANYAANIRVKGIPVMYMEYFQEEVLWLDPQ